MTHDPENPTPEPNITLIGIASRGKSQHKHAAPSRSVCDKVGNRCTSRKQAQLPHNLEWPHGTGATPERGAMRHTSQSSAALLTDSYVEVETSSPAADVDVAELEACAGSAGAASMSSSSSSSSLASGANFIGMRLCVRRGCGTWRARTASVYRHPSQTAVYCM